MRALGRSRGLTAAERALWHDWARKTRVVPMPGRALDQAPAAASVAAPGPAPSAAAAPATRAAPAARPAPPFAIQVGAVPPGLDERRWRDLRRGRTRPEATLDLHGYRVQEAHAAVRGFLRDAVAQGLRCVAIVTGRGASAEGGVLRRELPHWLNAPELRPLLLGAAHPHASNAGAVHLLLRRAHRAADDALRMTLRDRAQR
jgi:DNA-nicking Smr family endonuclease